MCGWLPGLWWWWWLDRRFDFVPWDIRCSKRKAMSDCQEVPVGAHNIVVSARWVRRTWAQEFTTGQHDLEVARR